MDLINNNKILLQRSAYEKIILTKHDYQENKDDEQ